MCVLSKLYSPSESKPQMTTQIPTQKPTKETNQENQESTSECAICYQENTDSCFTTHCNHIFCQDCMTKWLLTNNNCPLCRTSLVSINTTKISPHTDVNHVDDDDDEDFSEEVMENTPFEMTIVVPGELDVPDTVLHSALLRAHNLTTVLNHDDDDEEYIAPDLMTSWVLQKPQTANGWRHDDQLFTTTLMHKGVVYAIYAETLAEDHQTNVWFLASSNISYVKTYIVPISFKSRNTILKLPFSKQNTKRQRKQSKYRIHRNTAQSKQRYTHH